MYSEVVNGKILQTVSDNAPVTTQDGTQYPANYPKADTPNMVAVTDPGAPDPTLNEVTATEYQMVNGVPTVVYTSTPIPLATIQASQIAAMRLARRTAEAAPFGFTTAGGVTANFPMTREDRDDFHLAYSLYVLGATALPSTFSFSDVNGHAVPVVVADIKGLFEGAMARGVALIAQEQARLAAIQSATTPAAALAITW